METYLVYADAVNNSNKFWSAKVEGNNLIVQWGRVGYKFQTKTHNFNNPQQAISKYNNLVFEKKSKGYQETRPQVDSCSIGDIRRALQILNTLRLYVATKNFNPGYIESLNNYLKLVPTPLGMQIDPRTVYRTVKDVDHQIQLLNSLLPTEQLQQSKDDSSEKVVSMKSISKNFWRVV
ncbi:MULTISPECIES: WGR domain-containing protein [Nostoc]|uniref:WGR domain-containing protein n=1 Tax=Nostoc paludosum FACHB-159 TaxID=2692908 RepID=A0ABR8KL35_9NOSO|nr:MULTISPECIES: WGR domain-containing protein [Nostoc]MBD2682387.1 WGR domain-containing protein [Nostoc sp. FACHB-857]MBD2738788.1 WGR domain-containing protein [Nostoc paludosum FACHB-159]